MNVYKLWARRTTNEGRVYEKVTYVAAHDVQHAVEWFENSERPRDTEHFPLPLYSCEAVIADLEIWRP